MMHICSLNVRGLSKIIKRRHVFNSLQKFSISCLQECYITNENCELWSREWNGDFFFQCGSNHSKGLIILVNNNIAITDLNEIIVNDRILGISFKISEQLIIIFNIYAPAQSEDRVPFLNNLPTLLNLHSLPPDAYIIICGDFNMIRNNDLDIISGHPHSNHEVKNFNSFIETNMLFDCFRKLFPFSRDFSWSRTVIEQEGDPPTFSASRLDYIFCNHSLIKTLNSCEMSHFSSTDHKLISAYFKIDHFPRGPGRWQFNESLLDNNDFIVHMNSFLPKFILDLQSQEFLDKRLTFDLIKVGIRDECISFSRNIRLNKLSKNQLDLDIKNITNDLLLNPNDPLLINCLNNLIKEKEILDLAESKGALKRSRAQYIEFGEKNTKLFLGLEKSRQGNSLLRSVFDKDDNLVEAPNLILSEISNFYNSLLNDDNYVPISEKIEQLNTFLADFDHPKIDENDKNRLDSHISFDELKVALADLNHDSSPGIDGLSPIFYLQFWEHLGEPLFSCYTESIKHKSLSLSQRRAIISLLPKSSDLDQKLLSNWRPISLTSTCYKIFSKVLANRLLTVIKKLIHPNQVGFIPGRAITQHLRLLDDVINLCNKERIPGIVVSLDYRKAFDTLSKPAIIAALLKFNFGPMFIRYVETLLSNTEACVKNGGWMSQWFQTSRGIRQGCVVSPLLFIIVIEFLAIKIRQDKNIKGILDNIDPSFGEEDKCLLYADDNELLLQTMNCLSISLKTVDDFKTFSGLDLSRPKCNAMAVGGLEVEDYSAEGINWLKPHQNMKMLGVFYNSTKEASLLQENHTLKMNEINKLISSWSKRKLTLLGNCQISKMFMISQVNHLIHALSLPENVLNDIDFLLFQFVWGRKDSCRVVEKVKRTTLCLPIEEGGLGMISIRYQQQVYLLKWVQRWFKPDMSTQYKIINKLCKEIGGIYYVSRCDASSKVFKGLDKIKSVFWHSAIKIWLAFDKTCFSHNNKDIPLFNNSAILYFNKPLYIQKWISKNLKYKHQMFADNRILSLEEVKNKVGSYGGLLFDYLAVFNALNKFNSLVENEDRSPKTDFSYVSILNNKLLRNMIVKQNQTSNVLLCHDFWKRMLDINIELYFTVAKGATSETKLKNLHFRIIHNIYPSNLLLHRMKIKSSPLCDLCAEIDHIVHMFYSCPNLKPFWILIESYLEKIVKEKVCIKPEYALLGILKDDIGCSRKSLDEANHLLLISRLSIIKYRCASFKNLDFIFRFELGLRKKFFTTLVIDF